MPYSHTPRAAGDVILSSEWNTLGRAAEMLSFNTARTANGVVRGLATTAQGSPDMTLNVADGEALVEGQAVKTVGGIVTITTAHATLPRLDVVTIDQSAALAVVAGTAGTSPAIPTIAAGRVPVCLVTVAAADTTIASGDLLDIRVMIPAPDFIDVRAYGAVPCKHVEDAATVTVTITNASVANPTVITTGTAHGLTTGDVVFITGSNSTPTINGTKTVTVTDGTHFTVTVNVTVQGTTGTVITPFIDAASAPFLSTDVGSYVGSFELSSAISQSYVTSISGYVSASRIKMTNPPNRTTSTATFLWGTDATSAIQSAIDAAAAPTKGGTGRTVLLTGPGFIITGLVLKNHVALHGLGRRATYLFQTPTANVPAVRNGWSTTTTDTNAEFCSLRYLTIVCNAVRSPANTVASTLGAQYNVGDSTITVASTTGFNEFGPLLIGSNRLTYTAKTATTFTGVRGGLELSTDAIGTNGSAISQRLCYGVMFGSYSITAGNANDDLPDTHNIVEGVSIYDAADAGIFAMGRAEHRFIDVHAYQCRRHGFQPSYDSWLVRCIADSCGGPGIIINYSNTKLSDVFCFYNGLFTASTGHGIVFENLTTGCIGHGISVQDNRASGLYFRNAQSVVLADVSVDSNCWGAAAGTYPGIDFINSKFNQISPVNFVDRIPNPNTYDSGTAGPRQLYAVQTDATSINNIVRGVHRTSVALLTIGAPLKPGSTTTGNSFVFNNQEGHQIRAIAGTSTTANGGTTSSTQLVSATLFPVGSIMTAVGVTGAITITAVAPVNMASSTSYYQYTYTGGTGTATNGGALAVTTLGINAYDGENVSVATLTTSIAIANPNDGHAGCRLVFRFLQDATGGRVITFGNLYTTTWTPNTKPNARNAIAFTFDGTNWVQDNNDPAINYSQLAVAGGDTIASTAAATNFASGYTIPANALKVGQTIRVRASGVYSTLGSGTVSVRLRLMHGTTALLDSGTITTAISIANRMWQFEAIVTVITLGASGTVEASGVARIPTANTAVGVSLVGMAGAAVVVVDTTAAKALLLEMTHGASNSANTITQRQMTVEIMDQQ